MKVLGVPVVISKLEVDGLSQEIKVYPVATASGAIVTVSPYRCVSSSGTVESSSVVGMCPVRV